ncbi:MAG: hypothetical protein ACJAYU_004735 [Bradymonadia bacterium]|jgi:hypothetical protein
MNHKLLIPVAGVFLLGSSLSFAEDAGPARARTTPVTSTLPTTTTAPISHARKISNWRAARRFGVRD